MLSTAVALASGLGGCVWTAWDHDDWHHHGDHWDGHQYYEGGRWYHGRYWDRGEHWR